MLEPCRHFPLSQTPLEYAQVWPVAMHEPFEQQPAPSHVLPAQHGSPGAPQALHDPNVPLHARPDAVHSSPLQQLCPSPPQVPQPPGSLSEHVPSDPQA